MAQQYHLYIDELGEYTPKRYKQSPLFIVTGCIVDDNDTVRVKHQLDLIKYKYWSDTKITLHSQKIGRKEKDFEIFKGNPALFSDFTNDIQRILSNSSFSLIGVISDQKASFEKGWGSEQVIRESYGALYRNYIRMLVGKKATGTMIQEASSTFQDIKIYEKFFEYQTLGLVTDKLDHTEVKKRLTCVSFATKKDSSSLTEIADLLGYGIFLNHLVAQRRKKVTSLNTYQKMIRTLAKHKLTTVTYKNFQAIEIVTP
jgi:hypothetical protein